MTSTDQPSPKPVTDIVLIGAGIMSATLGVLLKALDSTLSIAVYERLDAVAAESSDAWNNAGTGHSAFCELNYTPERPDGSIDISKADKIAEQFEVSKQFWASLVQEGPLPDPTSFIHTIPHMSFVWGAANVEYLRKRHAALLHSPLFQGLEFSEDPAQIAAWIPLVMEGRDPATPVAATRMAIGTDVNFGSLTRCLFKHLKAQPGVEFHLGHQVEDFQRKSDGIWRLKIEDLATGDRRIARAKFVFIGAGGGTLPLLEKTDIPEASGFGGFPVSGQWLKCRNPAVIARHEAKVYGKPAVGSPPMSMPHLDTRQINGQKELLFGPYAGFSTKFLKKGSYSDLFRSIELGNIRPLLYAGARNLGLTRYLIGQVLQSPEDRTAALREYYPSANPDDWQLEVAGQRVQVIKKDKKQGGVLEFGTEMVTSADGSIAALLGASPGASTAVAIMLDLVQKCFAERAATPEWQARLRQMVPSFGQRLADNPALTAEVRERSHQALRLDGGQQTKERQ
ncbi:malate:quinone oxidoreductase [Hymenobacter sp. BT664]|uniref:Probable malate:quinone oxidoreductase n=1 Tax=Hymenobacter montanus TaxID=2771359 RepID=A0A927B9N7_9BACT|nr:malate:quinone oxidoreductase [Hymenobacter montanus]MBD2766671.1 malate:quinone oxidoreductase [Hymenobacter montanus]